MNYAEKLENAWRDSGSMICVGLDPRLDRLPESLRGSRQPFLEFNRRIIEATCDHACAFKPQFAYYAAADRLDELKATINFIRETCPGKLVILDAKRNDIGTTAEQYALEAFEVYGADAVTVNPYMGGDTLEPFSKSGDRGVVVLCKTSNPGSAELQDLVLESGRPLFEEVASRAASSWNSRNNLSLVVGATYPRELERIRAIVGDMPILVPGIGAQGGDLEATLRAGLRPDGWGLLLNSSRGILYASGGADFAEAAGEAARQLNTACLRFRQEKQQGDSL